MDSQSKLVIKTKVRVINETVLAPMDECRCRQYLELIIDLAQAQVRKRRTRVMRAIQKLINNTLDVPRFCEYIFRALSLKPRHDLVLFLVNTVKGLRLRLYHGDTFLRGIEPPPRHAIGIYKIIWQRSSLVSKEIITPGDQQVDTQIIDDEDTRHG